MNQRIAFVTGFLAAGLLLGATTAPAEMKWRGSGGWGAGFPYGKHYNPGTEQRLSGEVLQVDKLTPSEGMSDGLALILRTREESIPVHLGPIWYLERQDFSIVQGSRLEVIGSRVTFDGTAALIAAKVKKSDKVLYLRENSGFPLWTGWRRN